MARRASKVRTGDATGVGSLDPLFVATMLFRQRRYSECVEKCTTILQRNPYDRAAWLLKTRSLTEQSRIDETELEMEGLAEVMLDENATSQLPRPGTSFQRPLTNAGPTQGVRPMSKSGRPVSGFARPGTQGQRPGTMEAAMKQPRTATARPVTSASGRYVRLGTASMLPDENTGEFIAIERIDLEKYASRPAEAKALFLYLIHVAGAHDKALQLAALATKACGFKDWWWKSMLGFSYYRLGVYRDAEKQLNSSMQHQPTILTCMLLGKVYIRLDQPEMALRTYRLGVRAFPGETTLMAAIARVHDAVGNTSAAISEYKKLLNYDSTNVEAIASLAADHFYNNQPELALILYRRLLQMGVQNSELFNNLGLACFHAQQYDMAISFFDRALAGASDESRSDIWYNIGTLAVSLGDTDLAQQAFKLAVTYDHTNGEAINNLAVIAHRQRKHDEARDLYGRAGKVAAHIYEPLYNAALLHMAKGQLQEGFQAVCAALRAYPEHNASKRLRAKIEQKLEMA